MYVRLSVLIFLAMASSIGPAFAQKDFDPQEFYRKQYSGWGGVVFRCLHDETKDFERKFCADVHIEAKFLAATSAIQIEPIIGPSYVVASIASKKLDTGLIFTTSIQSTGEPDFTSVSISLDVGNHYSQAVDLGESEPSPEAIPRGGTLVLWNRIATGGGATGAELHQALVNAVEGWLKEIFSKMIDARNDVPIK